MTPEQYAQITGAAWTFAGTCVLAVIGFIANYFLKRTRVRASEPEMWQQLDKLSVEVYGDGENKVGLKERLRLAEHAARRAESKTKATGRVIRDLARQWRGDPPKLNPADLDEIDEEMLPLHHPWRVKPGTTHAPGLPGNEQGKGTQHEQYQRLTEPDA